MGVLFQTLRDLNFIDENSMLLNLITTCDVIGFKSLWMVWKILNVICVKGQTVLCRVLLGEGLSWIYYC